MSTGLNDIEQEEDPAIRIDRLLNQGVKLSTKDIVAIYNGTYVEKNQSNSTNKAQTNTNNNSNVNNLSESDPTKPATGNNQSGLEPPKSDNPPPPSPPPVMSYGTYTIFVKPGINGSGLPPHDKIGTHPPKMYQTYRGGDYTEERIFRFCKCEGDPDNVGFIRSEARMGFAPSISNTNAHGYYVYFQTKGDRYPIIDGKIVRVVVGPDGKEYPIDPQTGSVQIPAKMSNGTVEIKTYDAKTYLENKKASGDFDPNSINTEYYAPNTETPWINQFGQVQYIGDDKCPNGKKRLTADGVQLGEVVSDSPDKEEQPVKIDNTTKTWEKVEIQPIEYIGDFILKSEDGSFEAKVKSLKFPPIIIDYVTIPTGSVPTDQTEIVIQDDIDIVREVFVVESKTIKGDPPSTIIDDFKIEPIKFLSDQIKTKNNEPFTFRSITFPSAVIDSITYPTSMPSGGEIESIVVSNDPIIIPGKEYSANQLKKKENEEVFEETDSTEEDNTEIIDKTIVLKKVELKIPIKDKTTSLKFWNVMDRKPIITLDDTKNEELKIVIPNIMIPINPKKQHILDKMETTKLTINKSLIDYVPDEPRPTEVAKEKYTIYTMQGKTVPDIGDVYQDDDNGDRIYYGVNQPYRDKTPVKNDFEYCKCSGDDDKTSENRGYARLGIVLAGNTNQKYFKRDSRDRIAGTPGKYIGDDKCPDSETQVVNGQDPSQDVVKLIPDKEETVKIENLVVDTKKIVNEDTTGQYKDLTPDILNNLPEITIKMVDVPLVLEGGSVKGSVDKVNVDFSKLQNKTVDGLTNITVPNATPNQQNQVSSQIQGEKPNSEKIANGKKNNKKNKNKSDAKTKGKPKKEENKQENIDFDEQAISIKKGRSIPKSPGVDVPSKFAGKGLITAQGGYGRLYDKKGIAKYALWQWTWPIDATFNPGTTTDIAENWVKGESRPSGLKKWWPYFSNWKVSQPEYYWNQPKGSISEWLNSVGIKIMWDEQFGPFSMAHYNQKAGTLTLTEDNKYWGKKGTEITKPLNWTYRIWKDSKGWYLNNKLPRYEIQNGVKTDTFRYPYMIAGRQLINAYVPYGFGADWKTLISKFRFSKKEDPSGGEPNSPYGGPLPADYKPSLMDVGLLLNFIQAGYVTRYKLPNKNFPALAASGTEQHLMMLNSIQDKWVYGNYGDPMIGTFNGGLSIVVNWAHEPHWCGISTDFFLQKGGFAPQGTTSVKSNEENIINKKGGVPLNRPRLEDSIDEGWRQELWDQVNGDNYGVGVRELFKKAYAKHGAENCEHPITDEYIATYKDHINSIWFIGGIHYDVEKGQMTKRGYDLLRKAINPDIIDWPAAIISHTGHVESVAALDVDGDVTRLGGNTSTHGNFGNVNNTMGLYVTHLSKFGGYPGGGERGGFVLISKPDGINDSNRKHRVGGKGISSPWVITPVMRTYYDFLENNPDPEFPVFKNYYDAIQTINTIFNSNLR